MKLLGRHDRLSSRAHTYDWPLVIIAPGSRSGVVAIEFAMILILTVCEEPSSATRNTRRPRRTAQPPSPDSPGRETGRSAGCEVNSSAGGPVTVATNTNALAHPLPGQRRHRHGLAKFPAKFSASFISFQAVRHSRLRFRLGLHPHPCNPSGHAADKHDEDCPSRCLETFTAGGYVSDAANRPLRGHLARRHHRHPVHMAWMSQPCRSCASVSTAPA